MFYTKILKILCFLLKSQDTWRQVILSWSWSWMAWMVVKRWMWLFIIVTRLCLFISDNYTHSLFDHFWTFNFATIFNLKSIANMSYMTFKVIIWWIIDLLVQLVVVASSFERVQVQEQLEVSSLIEVLKLKKISYYSIFYRKWCILD